MNNVIIFPLGTVVVIENNDGDENKVDVGCKATVVNGKNEFPDLYRKMVDHFRAIKSDDALEEFVWVKWDKNDPKWKGIDDGAYHFARFEDNYLFSSRQGLLDFDEVTEEIVFEILRNNDGKSECYWCGEKTEKIFGFDNTYDVCPRCKK